MSDVKLSKDGSIHVTDEVFNTMSHMLGAMFALLGLVILIVKSSMQADSWKIVSFSLFGLSLFLVFLFSSLHHGVNAGKRFDFVLKIFDYLMIFPLIAGTYTPFCLVVLRQSDKWAPWGYSIFGVIWALAVFGIVIKSVFTHIPKWVTNTIYVGMGWVGAILIIPVFIFLGFEAALLVALGGVFYTVGSFIFYVEKPNPVPGKFGFHEIWHIFVILGGLTHYLVMFFYVLPYSL